MLGGVACPGVGKVSAAEPLGGVGGEGVAAIAGAGGNKRFQVSAPTIPSGVRFAAF